MNTPVSGICCLCGEHCTLTREHLPPQSANNRGTSVVPAFRSLIGSEPGMIPKGRIAQGGIWRYSLCGRCNNEVTGKWYVPHFSDWCRQGAEILIRSNGKPSLIYLTHLRPLPVIKQIVAMFASLYGQKFSTDHPYLGKFVLNKHQTYLPEEYRFYVAYNAGGYCRYAAGQRVVNVLTGLDSTFSEITFPPYIYVMTICQPPPNNGLIDISFFGEFAYEEIARGEVRLPVLSSSSYLPGDYRSESQIREHRERNASDEEQLSASERARMMDIIESLMSELSRPQK